MSLPPIPQSERQPIPLTEPELRNLLSQPHRKDTRDPFATDPDAEVSRLGRLFLRRVPEKDGLNDAFALGDRCARLSWGEADESLRVFYIGKALIAYGRALALADNDIDRLLARRAGDALVRWLADAALQYATRRNLAAALWGLAEAENRLALADTVHTIAAQALLDTYRDALPDLIVQREEDDSQPHTGEYAARTIGGNTQGDDSERSSNRLSSIPASELSATSEPISVSGDLITHWGASDSVSAGISSLSDDSRNRQSSPPKSSPPSPAGETASDSATDADSATFAQSGTRGVLSGIGQDGLSNALLSQVDSRVADLPQRTVGVTPDPQIARTPPDGAGERGTKRPARLEVTLTVAPDAAAEDLLAEISADDDSDAGVSSSDADDADSDSSGDISSSANGSAPAGFAAAPQELGSDHTLGGVAEAGDDASRDVPRAVRMTQTAEMPAVHTPEKTTGEFTAGQRIATRYDVADVRRGGMGIVYLCYDHTDRTTVAIKTFQSRFLDNKRAVARFEQEALTWIRIEKHPHVVQAKLVQNIAGRPHIFLEHISGPEGLEADLKSWIARKRLTAALSVEFALHIALGMAHAVSRVPGLVHRDLKPANILVTHDNLAKVTDFGLARLARSLDENGETLEPNEDGERVQPDPGLTRAGAQIGTPAYMSPEQWAAKPDIDLRADIYAFGCVLYEMLVGRPIFKARKFEEWNRAHQNETPAFPPESRQSLPPALTNFVLRCVSKQPRERPSSWEEVADRLMPLYESLHGQAFVPLDASRSAMVVREWVDKGYSLTELGHYEEALAAYDRAIALEPESAWAWARRGRTLRLLERYDDALHAYDESLRLKPDYAWAWKGKGIIHERLNQLERALECYRVAAQYDPLDAWNWYNQADALSALGDMAGARAMLEKAIAVDPRHANSWGKIGQMERQQGHYAEAAAAYQQAILIDPTYGWAHNGYGLALKAMGKSREAVLAFKRAAQYGPTEFWHWYNLAETEVDLGHYTEAAQPARTATRLQPNNPAGWAKVGQVLRYNKRYLESLQAYNRSLDLQPENAWALNGRGMVLESLDRRDEALDSYMTAADIAPNDAWTWYNAGNLLVQMERYEEAVSVLHQAIRLRPTHARTWARLGAAYRALGEDEDAINALLEATEHDPGFAWAWSELGHLYQSQERFEDANAAFARAGEIAPRDPLHVQQQADAMLHLNRADDALHLVDEALKLDATSARLHAKRGQILRRLGKHEDALRAYKTALDLDPAYAWAWNGRGMALAATNRHEEALAAFRKALEVDAGDVWYWYNYGESLVALNRHKEGAEALERALAIHPDHCESWAKLGQARRRLNQHEQAVTAYDRALQLDPRYAWAWNGRGMSLEQLGKREEARASFETALREDDGVLWYHTNYIDLLMHLNRIEEALGAADRALRSLHTGPLLAQIHARRGQALRRLDRYREAVEAYVRAVALDSSYAWAWNGLGLAYMALQQPADARDALAEATRHNPRDVWFWINYGDALYALGDCTPAADAYERALGIKPEHETARRKLGLAKECM